MRLQMIECVQLGDMLTKEMTAFKYITQKQSYINYELQFLSLHNQLLNFEEQNNSTTRVH